MSRVALNEIELLVDVHGRLELAVMGSVSATRFRHPCGAHEACVCVFVPEQHRLGPKPTVSVRGMPKVDRIGRRAASADKERAVIGEGQARSAPGILN